MSFSMGEVLARRLHRRGCFDNGFGLLDSCWRSLRLGDAIHPSRRIAELQAIRHPPHMAAFAAFTLPCGEGENAFLLLQRCLFRWGRCCRCAYTGGGALTMDWIQDSCWRSLRLGGVGCACRWIIYPHPASTERLCSPPSPWEGEGKAHFLGGLGLPVLSLRSCCGSIHTVPPARPLQIPM